MYVYVIITSLFLFYVFFKHINMSLFSRGLEITEKDASLIFQHIEGFFEPDIEHLSKQYSVKKVNAYQKYITELKEYRSIIEQCTTTHSIQYSELDPRWLYAVYIALVNFFVPRSLYFRKAQESKSYQYPLQDKFIIFADAGTNDKYLANTCKAMLNLQAEQYIHLGDIYYAGTKAECKDFVKYTAELRNKGELWCIPGNHEYISSGQGFFEEVLAVCGKNKHIKKQEQETSFFALVSQKYKVLVVALDTGYKCTNFTMPPASEQMDDSTKLDKSQYAWLQKTMAEYPTYRVLVLTHHPVCSDKWDKRFFNYTLYSQVVGDQATSDSSIGSRQITAWLAGHDHRCVVYPQSYGTLQKVITIGHASMPIVQPHYKTSSAMFPVDKLCIPPPEDVLSGNNGFVQIELKNSNMIVTFYYVCRTTGNYEAYHTLVL